MPWRPATTGRWASPRCPCGPYNTSLLLVSDAGFEVPLRARLPAQETPGLGEIVLDLVFVTGDKDGLEPAVADLHRVQGESIGLGEIFLVGDEETIAFAVIARMAPLV